MDKDIEDYKVMVPLIEALNKIEQWIVHICTQELLPPEGCPRGHIGHLMPLSATDKAAIELYEFANKLYDSYLEEIDMRRSR